MKFSASHDVGFPPLDQMNAMPIFETKKEDGEFSTFPSPPEVAIWREGSSDVAVGRVEVS